jgi:hypothetical protein
MNPWISNFLYLGISSHKPRFGTGEGRVHWPASWLWICSLWFFKSISSPYIQYAQIKDEDFHFFFISWAIMSWEMFIDDTGGWSKLQAEILDGILHIANSNSKRHVSLYRSRTLTSIRDFKARLALLILIVCIAWWLGHRTMQAMTGRGQICIIYL